MNWNPSDHDLADHDLVSATKDAVACEFGEGLALLNLKSNIYYSLQWRRRLHLGLIQDAEVDRRYPRRRARALQCRAGRCKADVDALLKGMAENGLARLQHEALV